MVSLRKTLAVTLASSVRANTGLRPVSGHDFDIDVVYPSGLSFSTDNPPTAPLPQTVIQSNASLPQITLRNLENSSTQAQYISFVVITHLGHDRWDPSINGTSEVISWLRANQTLLENGTLSGGGGGKDNGRSGLSVEIGEYQNASLHVWQQHPNVTDYIFKNNRNAAWVALLDIWGNATWGGYGEPPAYVSYDFQRANIDFGVRNDTVMEEEPKSAAGQPDLPSKLLALCISGVFFAAYLA
ncbi:uncharacterized protein JN550_009811 [Neoarthrinium moseri]|uniref:uncharacterized protein n=1 Tax=Neoarthrinium moseri TaxID=1658444 RepID=UPI001FDE46D4|nr:uncharacterized protein JN550_009811 [Neoarthrinium moseri]KAI1863075.1 hypothetical protein JN550_009811 [Neoarthrinium moseri]